MLLLNVMDGFVWYSYKLIEACCAQLGDLNVLLCIVFIRVLYVRSL